MTQTLYTPSGRAREYAALACNPYIGCAHQCVYCFARNIAARFRPNDNFGATKVKPGFLRDLAVQARRLQNEGKTGQVLIAFSTDPYQPLNEREEQTRQAIRILHDHDFTVCLLTKGGTRALRDLNLFSDGDVFGGTLTFLDDKDSREWEPGAALPADRIASLRAYHDRGVPTWVSLEPVIRPEVTLEIIKFVHPYVDTFRVGKLNFENKLPPHLREQIADIAWSRFAHDAVALLRELGYQEQGQDAPILHSQKRFYIKRDLAAFLSP